MSKSISIGLTIAAILMFAVCTYSGRWEATPVSSVEKQMNEYNEVGSYFSAIAESKKTGKPIFMFFTARWCGWCHKMKTETLDDVDVRKALKDYIVVFIDFDKNKNLAKTYKVKGIPAYFVIDKKGDVQKSGSGYRTEKAFLWWLP